MLGVLSALIARQDSTDMKAKNQSSQYQKLNVSLVVKLMLNIPKLESCLKMSLVVLEDVFCLYGKGLLNTFWSCIKEG